MGLYQIHGMPSDHAQTFFYFMTYLAIFVILKYITQSSFSSITFSFHSQISNARFTSCPISSKSVFGVWSIDRCLLSRIQPVQTLLYVTQRSWTDLFRVYLHYHTVPQVIAGAFVGTGLGCAWYYFVNYQFMKYAPWIVEHPWAKYFLVRDYTPIPRLIHFQYESEYAEAK